VVLSVKLAVVVVAAAMAAPSPISLFVYPKVTRNNVIIRAIVERHPDNRKVVITVDNDTTYFRSTECQLDGDKASRICPPGGRWLLQELPSGEYEITAKVYKQGNDVRAVAVDRLRVVGLDTPPEDW
jgi:hypothetical protein